MFAEVTNQHVPSGAGDAGSADVLGGELRRETVEQPAERLEAREHLRVAGRVGAAAGDDVAAVLPVLAGGSEELAFFGQRRAERLL